eukprot:7989222-Prorocentrum_lima.AAC.1
MPPSPRAMPLLPRDALTPPRAVGASRQSERPPRADATHRDPCTAVSPGIKEGRAARRTSAFACFDPSSR